MTLRTANRRRKRAEARARLDEWTGAVDQYDDVPRWVRRRRSCRKPRRRVMSSPPVGVLPFA